MSSSNEALKETPKPIRQSSRRKSALDDVPILEGSATTDTNVPDVVGEIQKRMSRRSSVQAAANELRRLSQTYNPVKTQRTVAQLMDQGVEQVLIMIQIVIIPFLLNEQIHSIFIFHSFVGKHC